MRAESLAFALVYMLYEASCNKEFIHVDELRNVFDENEVATLIKLLRDIRIVVSRKEYLDTIRYVKQVLNLPKENEDILDFDARSDNDIIALNPAVIDEMRHRNGEGELSYHMVRRFIGELLSSLELTANVGSLRELVTDLAAKYDNSFKNEVAKDIVISHACSLSDVEKASLAAAKLVSPHRFNSVVAILLSRAQKLAGHLQMELTEKDIESYVMFNVNKTVTHASGAQLE